MLKLARHAMRTRFEIALADELDAADLRAAGEEAFDEIERVEAQLSAYRNDSELALLNAEAGRRAVRVEPRLFRLLERALALCAASDGTFDMTVGPLLKIWNLEGATAIPDDSTIATVRATIGMRENVLLDKNAETVRFAREGVRLDPGAIGKGYALERAAKLLREAGIKNALLHGGTSTIVALGAAPGESGWKVAVRHPENKDQLLAEVVLGDGQSLSVSAVHGKSIEIGGKRYGHVIDPRLGWPVENALLAAVVCELATDSDALSTGLLVLGTTGLSLLGARRPDAGLLVAESVGGTVRVATRGAAFAVRAA